jgi:haloalkane dehalogenase
MMIRYRTSEARAEENAALVRAVFDEIRARAPNDIRYVCYRQTDGVTFVRAYSAWLSQSEVPKLFVTGDPGAVLAAGSANQRFCRTWRNQREVTVKGRHFLQEDSPGEIGAALRQFVIETRHSAHGQAG